MSAPEPVTKQRHWRLVVDLEVPDTPDPAYDVMRCEQLADELDVTITAALLQVPQLARFEIEHLGTDDP
jgi:hypothetical protein